MGAIVIIQNLDFKSNSVEKFTFHNETGIWAFIDKYILFISMEYEQECHNMPKHAIL